jgi:ABC-type phosphate transport system substrate-binding protein
MPCNIEVCLRHSRAVATMAAVALVLAANGRASADDSSPTASRPVAPVEAAPYLGSVGTTAYAPMTLALEERSSSILFALEPVVDRGLQWIEVHAR